MRDLGMRREYLLLTVLILSLALTPAVLAQPSGRDQGIPPDPDSEKLTAELRAVKTNERSLGPGDLDALAGSMVGESASFEELRGSLFKFYSLNATDLEVVLIKVRELNRRAQTDAGQSVKRRPNEETAIQTASRELNRISLEKFSVPFHLAALRGNADFFEAVMIKSGVKPQSSNPGAAARASCPQESFPRYVGSATPWRLRLSTSIRIVSRPQDSGCNLRHGPFNGKIRNWISFSPSIWGMVYSNGWGGQLAANDNNFFYKWYTLPIFGLTPYHCMTLLYARVY